MNSPSESRCTSWGPLAVGLSLAAYFLYFNWDRVEMPFASDDMMNLGVYFRQGIWKSIMSLPLLWTNGYRPMAALFYLPVYYVFGLNPAPYQAAITLLIALNGYVFYRLTRNLGCERMITAVATLIAVYHPGLTNLQYNLDMIYDVLCFLFYFSTFNYYVRIRSQDAAQRPGNVLILASLFVCALNSKEMAVTLPVVLLSYELFYHRPDKFSWQASRSWMVALWPLVVVAALSALFVYGRLFGPNPLAKHPAYAPVFSGARFLEFQKGSLADLLCWRGNPGLVAVALIWCLVTYFAWRKKRPQLRFLWVFVLVSPLPIEFLGGRFQGCLYIPMAGWAILIAAALVGSLRALAELTTKLYMSRFPGKRGVVAFGIAVFVGLLFHEASYRKAAYINPAAADQGPRTREVISQLRELRPQVRPHSKIVFLNDPFVDWDMAFIAELFFRDKTLEIHVQRLNPLSPKDLAAAGSVFDFRNGQLMQIK